jgi:hypothetical protein
MALTTGKAAEVMFEKTKESYEHQMSLLPLTMYEQPDPGKLQNASNVVWYPVQQHRPIIEGFDISGEETGIIEETYPSILGTPKNDFIQQRADDMRDQRFWERAGEQSGLRQATELNKQIASAVALQGSQFIRSNATSGYDFISEAQALLNERQLYNSGRCFVLNDRDTLTFGGDLAARQTLQGRPEQTWATGQIGQGIAGFDKVMTGSFLPNIAGGADPATTVTGNQSFAPEAGSVNTTTGVVTNVDYRIASIPVAASASYNVGDKVTFSNAGTPVNALGLADKTDTGQAMTFTIVGKPDATTIQVYPKPIAADDAALSTLEKAYANIDTTILNAATVDRLNIDASNKTNLFWDKSAVEVIGGSIPAELFAQYDGMKVITDTMSNGQVLYMVYDGNIATLNFRYRLFTWYGITICNPQNCGVAVTF